MSDKYLDDYLSVIAIDVAAEEKTRIARMAVATLHRLHDAMRQMRDWRDDSARLKSNIWRMKMALRADDQNGNGNQQIDPLIAHQRTEISRLEQANGALENEVAGLKRALTRAEEDVARIAAREMGDKIATLENSFSSEREHMSDEILRLKKRLKEAEASGTSVALRRLADKLNEFARGDRTIEIVFASAIGRTVEMIIGLSEELVSVSESLHRSRSRNRNLRLRLDRLRAMLRMRCGNSAEYRKRIGELNNLAERLTGEIGRLRIIRDSATCDESSAAVADVVKHIGRLMNDLRNSLKSDREAMIAAGDPECLRYMKKVVSLKVNLKVLSVELGRSKVPTDKRSCENVRYERCLGAASSLNDFLREIDNEIAKLKMRPMNEHCKIGGVSGSRYMTKVAELEDIVKRSIAVIGVLKQAPPDVINADEKITGALEDLIERLCRKMRELEIFDDRANLRERVEQLEALVVYLKAELLEKNERIDALNDEHARVRLISEREIRERYERTIADVRELSETFREDVRKGKREISELSLERDRLQRRVAEMQELMKVEIDAARKELRVLRDDKETLLGETERLRDVLGERDKEIENVIIREDALKAALRAEIEDLRTKLGIASVENAKLASIIEGPGKRERLGKLESSAEEGGGEEDRERTGEDRDVRDELECLRAESNEQAETSLGKADKQIGRSEPVPDEGQNGDGVRSEGETSDSERPLTYRLNVRTGAGGETSGEFDGAMAGYEASENKVKQLRNEMERLERELTGLRSERGSLGSSMADADNKWAAMRDQVDRLRSESDGLRGRMGEHEAAAESLRLGLERIRTELEDAAVDAARLRAENSRILGDLRDALSLRSAEAEGRVRALSTENNELATRIKELDDENVALRERLNGAREENECLSVKLNRSRVESDGAKAESTLLRATCDALERDNAELRRERDDAKERIGEIDSECRVLGNRLRIQRMRYEALRLAAAALRDESNDCKNHSRKSDATRPPLVRDHHERGFDAYNETERDQNHSDTARLNINEQRDGGTEVKVESNRRGHDNEEEIGDGERKGELERARGGDEALQLERTNLRSENSEITMELAKGGEPGAAWTEGPEEIVGSALKRCEIASVGHGSAGTSNCSIHPDDPDTPGGSGGIAAHDIEIGARRMKADVPRGGRNFRSTGGERAGAADFGRATEEIRALKLELANLRDERATLRSRLETFGEELNALKSERAALREELAASRRSNFDLRLKVNDLRGANEKLRETNARLGEGRPRDAPRGADERTGNNFEGALSDYLKRYIFTERNLRMTGRRDRFDRVPPKNLVEKSLRHVEGQKS